MSKYEIHDFYCMKCGNKIPLPRKLNKLKESMHRKKLYCPFCATIANMVEVKTYEDKIRFREMFENGEFKKELEDSIDFVNNG